jgi:hypothetical protein
MNITKKHLWTEGHPGRLRFEGLELAAKENLGLLHPGMPLLSCPQRGYGDVLVIYNHNVTGLTIEQLDDIEIVHHHNVTIEIRVESQQTRYSLRFWCHGMPKLHTCHMQHWWILKKKIVFTRPPR